MAAARCIFMFRLRVRCSARVAGRPLVMIGGVVSARVIAEICCARLTAQLVAIRGLYWSTALDRVTSGKSSESSESAHHLNAPPPRFALFLFACTTFLIA